MDLVLGEGAEAVPGEDVDGDLVHGAGGEPAPGENDGVDFVLGAGAKPVPGEHDGVGLVLGVLGSMLARAPGGAAGGVCLGGLLEDVRL